MPRISQATEAKCYPQVSITAMIGEDLRVEKLITAEWSFEQNLFGIVRKTTVIFSNKRR